MRRVAAILLILCYAALGSGAMERWHNAQHAAEDAAQAAAVVIAPGASLPLDHSPIHDESNCPVHAQLHFAGMAVAWVPVLICLGLFVSFLTQLAPRLTPQRVRLAVACRGPPIG